MVTFKNISIIIPVGPSEALLEALLQDLQPVEKDAEIIIVKGSSRSEQLNEGAQKATRDFFWFLHADSRLSTKTLKALLESLNNNPHALHYFNLRFLLDGPPFTRINELGCWIRSEWMGIPFGDQGFCLSRENFAFMGGFPEDVAYGEDHVFIWRAHQKAIKLLSTGSILKTSARKYREQGWLKTTLLYYKLWTKQASLERKKLKKIQRGQSSALAVFVKTPGLTPIKTRLAQTIGHESALEFYEFCLQAMKSVIKHVEKDSDIYPYWAVAESAGLNDFRWGDFSRILQGDGGLGERLHCIYSKLYNVYQRVMLIGSDAPQLTSNILLKAHQTLQDKNKFVIGPARDGGFYLFGGSAPLPKEVWESVAYSQVDTCEELMAKVKNYGEIVLLPKLSDVDVYEDLVFLKNELQSQEVLWV
ncbi:MAG: TIGR04282 family arsenosugar biosynthesis glycosyltransferase [Deltaproteobacteria bacterium]|nr:TIGR04282 family arsenosugar biosynthesis glycosyltransferase [Deltaproteobacteria bacterium]